MYRTCIVRLGFLACVCLPGAVLAQQGHPLAGIWLGDWGSATARSPVVLELSWMDTTLSGNINPGFPDAAAIDVGELDSSDWTVHLEGTSTDEAGNPVQVSVDGKLDNLGSPNRTLSGTWRRGTATGDFTLTRE
jgi:hypothetical protein